VPGAKALKANPSCMGTNISRLIQRERGTEGKKEIFRLSARVDRRAIRLREPTRAGKEKDLSEKNK